MSGQPQPNRTGKASLVIFILIGAVCLIVGGLCGGGLTFMLAVRPVQRQWEQAQGASAVAERDVAQLGKAAQALGSELLSGVPSTSGQKTAAEAMESETNARAIFENIRAGRPQALLKRCSMEYRQTTYPDALATQLVKYPLPLRTEALGDEMLVLPPIDDKTHQYRYSTKTTEARPVSFTITMVFASSTGYGANEWLLDQLTITEGTAEKGPAPEQKAP